MQHMAIDLKQFSGRALLAGGIALTGLGLVSGTAQAFNPQPDPPGRQANVAVNQPAEVQSKPGIIAVNPRSRVHVETRAGA
jgi:hypothetical protein